MASKKPYMTLKQFLQRHQALSLYRDLLRTLKGVENPRQRLEMRDWIRGEFERQRHTTDEATVRTLLIHGRMSLKELKNTIDMTK